MSSSSISICKGSTGSALTAGWSVLVYVLSGVEVAGVGTSAGAGAGVDVGLGSVVGGAGATRPLARLYA